MHETISTHRVAIKAKNVGGKLERPNVRWCSSLISVSIINYQEKIHFVEQVLILVNDLSL